MELIKKNIYIVSYVHIRTILASVKLRSTKINNLIKIITAACQSYNKILKGANKICQLGLDTKNKPFSRNLTSQREWTTYSAWIIHLKKRTINVNIYKLHESKSIQIICSEHEAAESEGIQTLFQDIWEEYMGHLV